MDCLPLVIEKHKILYSSFPLHKLTDTLAHMEIYLVKLTLIPLPGLLQL